MHIMAKPSADNVGREFVRQYYTMLNKDPRQVHRFYSKNSVFFHGGPSNTHISSAIGQEQIYEKIEQLKFSDCFAKILQVDSQFTVGDSVVVQVCGEFSNNGEPTKKFVQTFVLVPEGLKKYHVHNDIFRYQEERFPDEVSDETGEGIIDSECDDEATENISEENNKTSVFEKLNIYVEDISDEEQEEQNVTPMVNGSTGTSYDELITKQNGEAHEAELEEVVVEKPAPIIEPAPTTPTYPSEAAAVPPAQQADIVATEPAQPEVQDVVAPTVNPVYPETDEVSDPEPEPEPETEPLGPVSWAAMAGKTPKQSNQNVRHHEPKKPTVVAPTAQPVAEPSVMSKPQSAPRGRDGPRGGSGSSGGVKDNTPRLSGRNAPDNYQVFIGNLPNGVGESQVRETFSKFGKIVEVRLNPKNFGFVIFDSPEPAEAVLKDNTITLDGQEINIEEKKPSGSLGRGGRGGNPGNRGKAGMSGRGGGMSGRGGASIGKGTGGNMTPGGGRGGGSQRGGGNTGGPGGRGGRQNRRTNVTH